MGPTAVVVGSNGTVSNGTVADGYNKAPVRYGVKQLLAIQMVQHSLSVAGRGRWKWVAGAAQLDERVGRYHYWQAAHMGTGGRHALGIGRG